MMIDSHNSENNEVFSQHSPTYISNGPNQAGQFQKLFCSCLQYFSVYQHFLCIMHVSPPWTGFPFRRHISHRMMYFWWIYSNYPELFGLPEPNVIQELPKPSSLFCLLVHAIHSLRGSQGHIQLFTALSQAVEHRGQGFWGQAEFGAFFELCTKHPQVSFVTWLLLQMYW